MHFILTAIGSYGDVHPFVGLGQRLRERGHRVQVLTNPYFSEVVESAGLELLPMLTADDYRQLIDHAQIWHPIRGVPYLFRNAVVETMRGMFGLLEQHFVAGETILVAHPLDVASRLFRERYQTPVALATLAPQALWSRHQPPKLGALPVGPGWPRWWNEFQFWAGTRLFLDPVLKQPISVFRKELGLPAVARLFPGWWFSSDLNLCLFPDWFGPVQPDWPRPVEPVGFPLWDGSEVGALADEVEQFLGAGEPPVLFTPGTANKYAADYFTTAVEACQQLGRRAMLLTKFAEQVPSNLPDTVGHFSFVPLLPLLPRTAAVVHHGGIGTSSQVLAAGVPQLVRPMAFDQYDNAQRLCKLGVAEQLKPKRFSVDRVVASLARLTSSTEVAEACQMHAARCDRQGLHRAADLLEALGGKYQNLPNGREA
ncbi:glycosyltransferase [Aeoliella mucimassa]|uniref:MurG-like transferase n=1 Tax=Aeoliella mucimassa TaxID=2527972 RepID=A0A518AIM9_9BACT|nr:nucleotide disphospho-sugar-binding domain-containing protein [Aeoliella mucimassa]QDU54593.1 MurG-like transferase [Aeoliella mucimassa]